MKMDPQFFRQKKWSIHIQITPIKANFLPKQTPFSKIIIWTNIRLNVEKFEGKDKQKQKTKTKQNKKKKTKQNKTKKTPTPKNNKKQNKTKQKTNKQKQKQNNKKNKQKQNKTKKPYSCPKFAILLGAIDKPEVWFYYPGLRHILRWAFALSTLIGHEHDEWA